MNNEYLKNLNSIYNNDRKYKVETGNNHNIN